MPSFRYSRRTIAVSVFVVAMLVVGPIFVTVGTASGLSNGWTILPAPQNSNANYYYNVVSMTVSYALIGSGSSTAPSFSYQQNGAHKVLKLKTTPTTITVDGGSTWSVSPNPLTGSSSTVRWESAPSQALSGLASSTPLIFTFYLQYLQKLSFSVTGGSGFSAPTFTAKSFGTPTGQVLTTSINGFWFDFASSWSVSLNPLSGSTSLERWFKSTGTSGTITGSATRAFAYQHQFFLTMQVSPSGAGSVTPSSGWHNAAQMVTVKAIANPGHKFTNWTGIGVGSFSGTTNPVTVAMNSAVTQTANFT